MYFLLMRTLLALTSLLSLASADPGFFATRWVQRTAPILATSIDVSSASGTADLSFTVSVADTVNKVLPTIFGNNINPWIGTALVTDNAYGLEHLRQAKLTNLRMPGGNWSNKFLWDGTNHWSLTHGYIDSIKGLPNATWTLTTDDMLSVASSIGAEPQLCVNFSLSRFIPGPDSIQQAAHYAADWVRHVNGTLGRGVKYWEVGNENYGNWQSGWLVAGDTMDGAKYGRGFAIFADSMKAADPTIKVGAVSIEQDNGTASGGYRWWMKKMLPLVQDKADYLIYHEYFTYNANINLVTVPQVLAGLSKIELAKDSIEAMVARYTTKPAGYFPIATTEYNVRAGTKDNQAVSGVFIATALAEFVRNGYGLVNLWDIANGWDAVNGDQGMLSEGETGLTQYTPHPSFYTYYLFGKCFGDALLSSTPLESHSVRIATTRFPTGELSVLLVNQSDTARKVQLDLGMFQHDGYAYTYTIQAASATSPIISLNGHLGANYGPLDYVAIPPNKQPVTTSPLVDCPPWSVQFVLLKPSGSSVATLAPKLGANVATSVRKYDLKGRAVQAQ